MMNERIEKLALDAGLLNYVDNETPTRFFVDGHADLEEVQKFAELIVRECMDNLEWHGHDEAVSQLEWFKVNRLGIK
jgi:hypothetical protein